MRKLPTRPAAASLKHLLERSLTQYAANRAYVSMGRVLRYSDVDLDAGTLRGGRFKRITPMVNWHLSDNIRLEFAYGYGELDRFDLTGKTRFFTMRTQFTL